MWPPGENGGFTIRDNDGNRFRSLELTHLSATIPRTICNSHDLSYDLSSIGKGGTTMGQSKPFRPTALVVEDDPIQREMIVLLLKETDYDVIQCEDAETAELALSRDPALLITDISLVGAMTGIELMERAREANPALRVIVMSGLPLAQALPDGVTFFAKPFYAIELIREVSAGRGN
jgi:two-component system cell cycle response regulator CpdR